MKKNKKKIVLVGASGTIGKRIFDDLVKDHIVITASRNGEHHLDITSKLSITDFFEKVGFIDALICTAGKANFGPIQSMSDAGFLVGINSKLMGQINLVLLGQHFINDGGSITLTSGVIYEHPQLNYANFSTVNGGINAFVKAAAIELSPKIRINVVCPTIVEHSSSMLADFQHQQPVAMERVVRAYQDSIYSKLNGEVIKVY